MMVSQWTPETHCQTLAPQALGGTTAGTQPVSKIEVEYTPLLGGIAIRLSCADTTWKEGFGADSLFLHVYQQNTPRSGEMAEIYSVEAGQNMTLQKTLLGLKPGATYNAQFLLSNADALIFYASPTQTVQTRTTADPI
jgi:hypothetical protein